MPNLHIIGNDFVFDGKPIRLLSGAIHYFRVMPEYWRDRLLALKACGLNTLETYVAWNVHEPRPGEFHFDGRWDLVRFVEIAAELGLHVIVRPGPYICSEWDLGGLPSWLLKDPHMRLRCAYPPYLKAVDRFFDQLLSRLAPLQTTAGGPIIAMQVENEYGSFGSDKVYLKHLEDGLRARGIDVPLFTSDGGTDWMLVGGTLPHVFKVVNFGSRPAENFAKLREHQPEGPLMCGEYWNGWFDFWGGEHHVRSADEAAAVLDEMLALGASVNFYMFHGGTSFGFMPGANHDTTRGITPDVNSYDFNAPMGEAGDITEKFYRYREVIAKYAPVPDITPPPPAPRTAFGRVALTECAPLFANLDALSTPVKRPAPVPMEELDQDYGFILYRTRVQGPREANPLVVQELRDRALIFVDGDYKGVMQREKDEQVQLAFDRGDYQLDVLVENLARINYGPRLHERKGVTHGIRLSNQFLYGWTIYPLPLHDLSRLSFAPIDALTAPAFYRGTFTVDIPADTFLAVPGGTKGVCFLNGFNLGRYWDIGPQRTLYVPAPLLRKGENELIIFELHGLKEAAAEFRDTADLG